MKRLIALSVLSAFLAGCACAFTTGSAAVLLGDNDRDGINKPNTAKK